MRNPGIGRRYPDLIFLSLCWSVTCAVQSYQLLKDKYLLEKRGLIQVKGKGEIMTYILKEINPKA